MKEEWKENKENSVSLVVSVPYWNPLMVELVPHLLNGSQGLHACHSLASLTIPHPQLNESPAPQVFFPIPNPESPILLLAFEPGPFLLLFVPSKSSLPQLTPLSVPPHIRCYLLLEAFFHPSSVNLLSPLWQPGCSPIRAPITVDFWFGWLQFPNLPESPALFMVVFPMPSRGMA